MAAKPPTGRPRGRPKGAKSQHTRRRETKLAKIAEELDQIIPGAFQGDAHAYLMAVYKDPNQPTDVRLDAAKAAIRYEKPALASVDMKASVKRDVDEYSDAELIALALQCAGHAEDGAEAAESPRKPHGIH